MTPAFLVDTDVISAFLRDAPGAEAWWRSEVEGSDAGISGFVAFELLTGASSRREIDRLRRVVDSFAICWPTGDDLDDALDGFEAHYKFHGASPNDAIIAHTAASLDVPLLTFNLRHFEAIRERLPALEVRAPSFDNAGSRRRSRVRRWLRKRGTSPVARALERASRSLRRW